MVGFVSCGLRLLTARLGSEFRRRSRASHSWRCYTLAAGFVFCDPIFFGLAVWRRVTNGGAGRLWSNLEPSSKALRELDNMGGKRSAGKVPAEIN